MPRSRILFILRLLLSAFSLWLVCVIMWFILPSPDRFDDGSNYATQILRSGQTLTRVYNTDDFFPHTDASEAVRRVRKSGPYRWFFALDFRLAPDNTNTIEIGGNRFDLDAVNGTTLENSFEATARAGDDDGINLPWFDKADSALLFWWIQRDDKTILFDVKSPNVGTVEFWPAVNNPKSEPILALDFAQNSINAKSLIAVRTPRPPHSSSPTSTYRIRVAILMYMAPVAIAGMALFSVAFQLAGLGFRLLLAIVYTMVGVAVMWLACVTVWWLWKGQPSVRETLDGVEEGVRQAKEWWVDFRARGSDPAHTQLAVEPVAEVVYDLEAQDSTKEATVENLNLKPNAAGAN